MTRADDAEKKAGELNIESLKLIEQESLAQAKAITLEEELTRVKEDLQSQKAMYEAQLESLRDSHRVQVENLEKEADNQYDQGLRHSYRYIMAVLGKQHPDLKMDDLAAGVAQHMDEEAAKEDAEGVEPVVIEEENSPPRAISADVGEASTPPDATGLLAFALSSRLWLRIWSFCMTRDSARFCSIEQILACLASGLAIDRL
ncbi:hypothetical protein AB3S75_013394 [Citrus x aurantiifolia]